MEKPFRMSQREETGTGAYMGLCLGSEHSTREVVLTQALPERTLADLEESPPKHRVPCGVGLGQGQGPCSHMVIESLAPT